MWRQIAQQGDPAWRRSRPESQRPARPAVLEVEPKQPAASAVAAEKLAAEKLAAEKLAAEKLAAEKLAAEKLAAEKLAAEKLAAEKLAAEKLAAEKLAAEKLAAEKLAAAERSPKAIPNHGLDVELRQQLAEADALITQYLPSASPALLERMRSVLRTISREQLQRPRNGSPGGQMDVEQLRQQLVRMSLEGDDGEKELAGLRRQLQHYHAFGAWPAGTPAAGGSPAKTADYTKQLALLTRIVEENIALRSGRESEQEA